MSEPVHSEQDNKGLLRHLVFNGILKMGAPFAVVMQIVGVLVLRDDGQSIGNYFAQQRTWVTFFLHATAFGLTMGIITWFKNKRAVNGTSSDAEK
ncbi:MAG: hypothetical protein JO314_01390 [Acidobacteria bacterium]|nr:hypothetical protein [Acidobacteriota bacterium]